MKTKNRNIVFDQLKCVGILSVLIFHILQFNKNEI